MTAIKTKIKRIRKVASGTTEVLFVRPESFNFIPGQYIQVALTKLAYPDSKGLSRVFSIASSPNEKDELCIVFRDSGSGYKKTLSELAEGSELLLEGPHGSFAPMSANGNNIFIAGGIGIAPFLSVIKSTVENKKCSNLTLVYINKNEEYSAYLEYFRKLSANSKNFSCHALFERLKIDYLQKQAENNTDANWWIVGPPGMVADVKYMLENIGVHSGKIYIEEFTGY